MMFIMHEHFSHGVQLSQKGLVKVFMLHVQAVASEHGGCPYCITSLAMVKKTYCIRVVGQGALPLKAFM
jgi:hypothetical protein